MNKMISRDDIYFEAIKSRLDYFRQNKVMFNMLILPTEDTPKLPSEAYYNGTIFCSFDFGAEETWTADQIELKDNIFTCVLVYQGIDGWDEYWISVPIHNILSITDCDLKSNRDNNTTTFLVTKYSNDFQIKVNKSKKHLRMIRSWEQELWQ